MCVFLQMGLRIHVEQSHLSPMSMSGDHSVFVPVGGASIDDAVSRKREGVGAVAFIEDGALTTDADEEVNDITACFKQESLVIDVDETRLEFEHATIGQLVIKGNGGDDNIRIGEVVGKRAKPAGVAEKDTSAGGIRNDRLAGQLGRDRIGGGEGHDRTAGVRGADTLRGGNENDVLLWRRGKDQLHGGAGCDQLIGGAGMVEVNAREEEEDWILTDGLDQIVGDEIVKIVQA